MDWKRQDSYTLSATDTENPSVDLQVHGKPPYCTWRLLVTAGHFPESLVSLTLHGSCPTVEEAQKAAENRVDAARAAVRMTLEVP